MPGSSAGGAARCGTPRPAAAQGWSRSSARGRYDAARRPAGRRRARGRGTSSFHRPQRRRLVAELGDAAMDQELDGAGRLAHGDRYVLDLHVLLKLQDEGRALLVGQLLDEGPDAAQLIPMSGQVLERRPRDRQVVEVV